MKKNTTKKLSLSTQTVKKLTPAELQIVRGMTASGGLSHYGLCGCCNPTGTDLG
jgi:hypothetical protein